MSLHGLDDAVVTSAYQSALAEAGGWFLLKYVSREAVDVLDSGTRGAAECRAALARYDEKSPLYGFLLYRRRKVLLKYTPEGTSRVLLARTAIHFNDVAASFTPHDITMTINSPDEFSDTALASACSLHTAAPSTSSSSSSRKKLDEITESAEEPVDPDDIPLARLVSKVASEKAASISHVSLAEDVDIPAPLKIRDSPPRPSTRDTSKPESPLRRVQTADQPSISQSHETAGAGPPLESSPASYRTSLDRYDELFKGGPDPRASSQTARPAIDELYAEMYAEIAAKYNKPKVKLAPRPKVSLDGNRPNTGPYGRPVSTLPSGMRLANRKAPEPIRPKSRETSAVPSLAIPAPPPISAFPIPPSTPTKSDAPSISPMFPPKSPASVRSMTLPGQHGAKSGGTAQEKQRLMKALELRKKQMKARQEAERKSAGLPVDEKPVGKDVSTGQVLTVGDPEPVISPPEEETPKAELEAAEPHRENDEKSFVLPMPDFQPAQEPLLPAARVPPETEEKPITAQIVTVEVKSHAEEHIEREVKASPSIEDSGIAMTSSLSEVESSSPVVYTHDTPRTSFTRPSSVSEGDHASQESESKRTGCDEATLQKLEMRAEPTRAEDEKLSAASSPTVVPEISTPVVTADISVRVSAEISLRQAPTKTESLASAPSPAVPLILTNEIVSPTVGPPSEGQDVHLQKKTKRESMVVSPIDASPQPNEAPSKREKGASLTLNVPKRRSHVENKEARAMGDPIQIQLNGEASEEYLSDDSSFMEELKSATVQEAKPISVSKSPITPFFPRKPSVSESERSTSGSRVGRMSPEQSSVRKISAGWPPPTMKRDENSATKRVNVSSGISQRIKALAEKSSKDKSPSVSPLGTPDASASVAQRKSSFFSTLAVEDGKTLNRLSRASFAKLSSTTAPDSQSATQFAPSSEASAVYNVKETAKESESVQVTARIVRDAQQLNPSLTMPTENTPLELQPSQITVDHQISSTASIKGPPKSSSSKTEPTSSRPPSVASKDPISPNPRSSSESSWRAFGRRLSESKSAPPRSLSAHSSESTDDKREDRKEKKESRTSKMFKRMSSISSMSSRKSAKEDEASSTLQPVREPPPPVQIGDLNVQFPDTLLWKRRWVEIDSAGNIVMSMSRNEQSKATTKRFHLRELRAPYVPDQDAQELPNSVAFDFLDGRTMQCACETYAAQAQVLQVLREAHDAWMAYDQGS